VLVLATLAAVHSLRNARADFSLEELYPDDSPRAVFHAQHLDRFGRDDNLIFAVREGSPFDPSLSTLETIMGTVEGIEETRSPASSEIWESRDGVLSSRPLSPFDDAPLVADTLVARDGSSGAVALSIADDANHHAGREPIVRILEATTQEVGGTWHLAGIPIIRTAYIRLLVRDLVVLLPLVIAVSSVLLVLAFRDMRQVAMAVASIILGAILAGGMFVALGGSFNVFSPAFLAVVVVVGTSDLVHLVHRYTDHYQTLGDTRAAAEAAAEEVGPTCLLTSVTTAIGFLALTTTNIPNIRLFGLATGLGVVGTYLVAFLLVPPILARIAPPTSSAGTHTSTWADRVERIGRWSISHRRALLASWVVICVLFGGLTTQLHADHRILEDVRDDAPVARAQAYMEDHLGAVLPFELSIHFEGNALEPERLAAVEALTSWMEEQPQVGRAVSLADLTRSAWRSLSSTDGQPPDREAAAQALLVLGLGEHDPVPHFLDETGQTTRIAARIRDHGHQVTSVLAGQVESKARELLSPVNGTATVTGVAYLAQEVNVTLTSQFAGSFGLALLVIGSAWLFATRSPRRTVIALIPNLVPLVLLLGWMGAAGIPLKPTTAMVLSIGLGMAVDDSIHFLANYEHVRTRGGTATEAAVHAYRTAGRSMLDTTIVLAAGFMVLLSSAFVANSTFGGLTAWTVIAALCADLFLLGPLLVTLDRREMSPGATPAVS
jgi:hypothetical protein